MKINPVTSNKYRFRPFSAAIVNINAFSDTHGELLLANNALEEMRAKEQDIFCHGEKGSANVLAICGDWFMDGAKKGYATNLRKPQGMFQLDILNEFIRRIKDIAGDTLTLFTDGNHEFDGGVALLDDIHSKIDAEVLLTNLDIENSPAFEKSIKRNKIVNQKIIEVEDDKNADLKHKLLFLGICPVNMKAYQRDTKGLTFLDNADKPQAEIKKEDYRIAFNDCKRRISKFKEENPNGIVILMSHTGVRFADNLAEESNVDLIFDGHEHEDDIRVVNGTPIIPLSQNFQKIVNARIRINDKGKTEEIKLKSFSPLKNKTKGPLWNFYINLFKIDVKKLYSIRTNSPKIDLLDIKDVRIGNNFLANFVTDSILEEIQKEDSSVDFFALNASAIRHSLKVSENAGVSAFDIMHVLAGIREDDGEIMTTELEGRDIVYMVLDNFLFNKNNPQKNPLIHYSGLSVDRTGMLKAYQEKQNLDELAKYVIDSRTNMPLEPDRTYKIANVEKYFNKSRNEKIKKMKSISQYTGNNIIELFKRHFTESSGILNAKCDVRIK